MRDKSSEGAMRELVSAVGGPRGWNETREAWLSRVARTAGVSFSQARRLFYREITDPEHKAARRMQLAAERKAKQEAGALAQQFTSIAEALNASDPDFYSPQIAALINAARLLGGLDRPGDNHEGE